MGRNGFCIFEIFSLVFYPCLLGPRFLPEMITRCSGGGLITVSPSYSIRLSPAEALATNKLQAVQAQSPRFLSFIKKGQVTTLRNVLTHCHDLQIGCPVFRNTFNPSLS